MKNIKAIKRIVRSLKGTIYLKLIYSFYPKNKRDIKALNTSFPFGLIGYGDSNYAEDPENKKLIMGYCYSINGAIISQCNKKQRTILTSTIEAKYIAFGHMIQEVIWLKHFLISFKSLNLSNASLYMETMKLVLY